MGESVRAGRSREGGWVNESSTMYCKRVNEGGREGGGRGSKTE